MTTVIHADLKALGYCNKGARAFCTRHGLRFSDLLDGGIDAQQVLDTGDHMAAKVVEQAQARENGRQQEADNGL